MRRWRAFILLVLGVSLVAVCVETAVMAASGAMRLGAMYPATAWRGAVDAGWPAAPDQVSTWRGAVIDAEYYRAQAPPEKPGGNWRLYFRGEARVGWPLRCAEYDRTFASRPLNDPAGPWYTDLPESVWRHGFEVPKWMHWGPRPAALGETLRRIPVRPIWWGLLVNVLVNTCVLGPLMLVPGWVRRRWRRKNGRCAACGYLLTGLGAGAGAACPECGARRGFPTEGTE